MTDNEKYENPCTEGNSTKLKLIFSPLVTTSFHLFPLPNLSAKTVSKLDFRTVNQKFSNFFVNFF